MDFKATFSFLNALKKNNTKEWFDANRKTYEAVKKDVNAFIGDLIENISTWDENIVGLQPKDCIFRINRDIRFAKDKSPYKTNMGAVISKGGRKSQHAGYYIHLEPGGSFLAGGCWMPEPDHLKAIRQELDYGLDDFKKLVGHKDFKKYFSELKGEKLVNLPKGYDATNPAAEFLKHKSFLMVHNMADKDLDQKHILSVFKAMKPMDDFLNRSLE